MPIASAELIRARETTTRVLEELGLESYVFQIEPGEGGWELKMECSMVGGWGTLSLPIDKESLLAGSHDEAAYRRLREGLRRRLAECRVRLP